MTKITSAIAAALIASASFASAALAEGDYYEGASKASSTVDNVQTGSIAGGQQNANQIPASVDRGDYYTGANRPN
jgi:homoserine kinase